MPHDILCGSEQDRKNFTTFFSHGPGLSKVVIHLRYLRFCFSDLRYVKEIWNQNFFSSVTYHLKKSLLKYKKKYLNILFKDRNIYFS